MYIEIRKIRNKNLVYGNCKAIEPIVEKSYQGEAIYTYKMSEERFERPNITYKFIAKHTYRENGKVKSKSAYLGSFTWSDVVDSWDNIDVSEESEKKIKERLGIDNSQLKELLTDFYEKADEVIAEIEQEYANTEESVIAEKNNDLTREYRKRLQAFEEKYGKSTYSKVYDFHGKLKNPEMLQKIKDDYKAKKKYEEESARQKQEYWDKFYREYSSYSGSSQLGGQQGAYTEDEKLMLKKFYRTLSQKFHPDCLDGSNEAMSLINRLKQQWNL